MTSIILIFFCFTFHVAGGIKHDYKDALAKSIEYFQAQRSGKLPVAGQDIDWRGDSGLTDGQQDGVNLTGGYYDAGDNVKFNFPMAFTATMLSWGAMEYGKRLGDSELENLRTAIRWDELLWAAAWMLRATNDANRYRNLIDSLGDQIHIDIFSWDNKNAGAVVLLARRFLVEKEPLYQQFSQEAEEFLCKILPESDSPYSSTRYTPGGLMYKIEGGNLQYVTAISFLMTTYAKYMAASKHTFSCGDHVVTPKVLRNLVKKQVNYILGDNPNKMSNMVGYGVNYPIRVHHRGASMPSKLAHPTPIPCYEGFNTYLHTSNPNPNILTGAIVGGPDFNDIYHDDRNDPGQSEASTYYGAPLVGTLAYLANWKKK